MCAAFFATLLNFKYAASCPSPQTELTLSGTSTCTSLQRGLSTFSGFTAFHPHLVS